MSASYLHLDTKVDDIVDSCRSVDALHPIVIELCQLPEFKEIFWNCLNQDLHVIRQRSQVLTEGEITIFQKAFMILMQNKEDVIPAIDLYVNEILGLNFVSETERATTLSTMIQTRHSVLDRSYGSKPREDLAPKSDDSDDKLMRLFIVYHQARKDFDTTPAKTPERTKSAKFLRDTTENCLAYIAAKQTGSADSKMATCDEKLLDELRATLEETIAIAEQGSGGKKRRFDERWVDIPQEPAKMRTLQPLWCSIDSNLIQRGRTSEKKRRHPTSRTREIQVLPEAEYTKQRLGLAGFKRSDLPYKRYPSSTSQSVFRVFADRYKPHAERNPSSGHVHGDRYRPAYRSS